VKKRYIFIDLLRALAVAEMIHGHSLDGLLQDTLRSTSFFVNWTHVRGYTAPVFLFAAGFAFALATLPRSHVYSHFSKTLLTRLRRLFFVILLGYLMYLPFFSLRKTILSVGTSGWDNFLRVDILRCIGVSALFLQFWFLLKPKRLITWITIGAMTVALPMLTPIIRQSEFIQSIPAFIKYYFVDSRFPLFYYTSFLFAGFLTGLSYTKLRNNWWPYATATGALLIIFGLVVQSSAGLAALSSFIIKCGVIILLTVMLERGENLWERLPLVAQYFGKESLVVYVVHLMIIYGSVVNTGLVSYWGRTLSYTEVYLFILWLFTAMVLIAYFWHRLKIEHMPVAVWVKNTIYWSFLVLFLVRPY
jgi:hypothetical protein